MQLLVLCDSLDCLIEVPLIPKCDFLLSEMLLSELFVEALVGMRLFQVQHMNCLDAI